VTDLSRRERFVAGLGFSVDDFQLEAFAAVDEGENVLVSAPTGSGKTLVATYAIERVLSNGGRAFYTTPLKALSNQKFNELVERYGAHKVGLLTGDNSVNPDADVVVMTTEVLRNMLLTESSQIQRLTSSSSTRSITYRTRIAGEYGRKSSSSPRRSCNSSPCPPRLPMPASWRNG